MKRAVALSLVLLSAAACRPRLEPVPVPVTMVIPQPERIEATGGRWVLPRAMGRLAQGGTEGTFLPAAQAILGVFLGHLRSQGWEDSHPLHERLPAASEPAGFIRFAIEPGEMGRLGGEGYALEVTGKGLIGLTSARPAGLFYGVQTLRQLLMTRSPGPGPDGAPPALPCLKIVDRPRYPWRGFMLDCCRHFFPKEFIKKCLDEMALFKLNRFHWHLTDDQGWRIEIQRFPELAEKGGSPTGGYYTQEDIREIVAYAAERFITVVPEIEMPGHATAALAVHPELSCTGGPFARMPQWGVFEDVYCAGREETFAFLQGVLDEVTGLFPGAWVHVGGDECPKSRWKSCPRCRARMRSEGLKDEMELQSWFIRRVEAHLRSRGKRLVGWDEILEGGLAPDATVMSWRGMEGGIEAARQGHDVVMAPTTSNYLDYYQGDPRGEPPAIGGFLPLEKVYAFDPAPSGLSAGEAAHVLGGQANLWTEYIATPEHASYMMWPRLAALAEAVWSAPAARGWDSFLRRLGRLRPGLAAAGIRLAGAPWRPVIAAQALPAERAWRVEMVGGIPGAAIRYTRDGGEPGPSSRLYRAPFVCRSGGVLRAALFAGGRRLGPAAELPMRRHPAVFAAVRLGASGSLRPEQGGEALLVDGLHGSLRHGDGAWLGVEGGDLEVVIDLGRRRAVQRVAARFLDHPAAWIFPPARLEAAVSPDGREWTPVAAREWPPADDFTVLASRAADLRCSARRARYVRLTARGIGSCPPGHVGEGKKAWLFVDEVIVE